MHIDLLSTQTLFSRSINVQKTYTNFLLFFFSFQLKLYNSDHRQIRMYRGKWKYPSHLLEHDQDKLDFLYIEDTCNEESTPLSMWISYKCMQARYERVLGFF